jgi:hypothetical protein
MRQPSIGLVALCALVCSCSPGAAPPSRTSTEAPSPARAIAPSPEGEEYSKLEAPPELSRSQRADFFLTQGTSRFERREYGPAAACFRSAILEDSTRLDPHFRLARALARLRQASALGQKGEEELFDEIAICLGLDATKSGLSAEWMAESLRTDEDFASLRADPRLQSLLAEAPAADPEWRAALVGDWSEPEGACELRLGDDSRFAFKNHASAFRDKIGDSRGSWGLEDGTILVLSPEDANKQTPTVEFDAGRFAIYVFSNADKSGRSFEMRKRSSPLMTALLASDLPLASRLIASGVMPPYGTPDQERKTLLSPLSFALESDRRALVRLLIGKEGFGIRTALLASDGRYDARYRPLLEAAIGRNSRERLQKEAASSSYPVEWYEKLTRHEPNRPFIRLMGRNDKRVAILTDSAVSIVPIEAESGVAAGVGLPEPIGKSASSYRFEELTVADARILRLMDREKEWLALLASAGIQADNAASELLSLPAVVDGKSVSLSVDTHTPEMSAEDDGRGPSPISRYVISVDGRPKLRSEKTEGIFAPLGGLAAGSRFCVFLSFESYDSPMPRLVYAIIDM